MAKPWHNDQRPDKLAPTPTACGDLNITSQALEHAKQAEKAKADAHIIEAETLLNQAIEHGNIGHADIAANHAKEAMRHLEMAYKGTTGK